MDRFSAARANGFSAVEYLFPYDHEAEELAKALADANLVQVLFNAPPGGDFAAGARGVAAIAGREREFRDSIGLALDYAAVLEVGQVHVMAGIAPDGMSLQDCRETYVANLCWAAHEASRSGVRILIEPINPVDMPGYFLNSVEQAVSIIGEINAPNLLLQYDFYHRSRSGGNLIRTFERHLDLVGHVQIAGNPGRHEPDHGEINYPAVFAAMDQLGYAGWVGCEYHPAGNTIDGLAWLHSWSGVE